MYGWLCCNERKRQQWNCVYVHTVIDMSTSLNVKYEQYYANHVLLRNHQRIYYNISPCWSFSTAGILVHYRRCNLTLLESRSRAGAGVRLNSRYYQVAVLETCSTGWRSSSTGWRLARQQVLSSSYWRLARQQVLETCSTAGGNMQLHIISFERREGNSWSHQQS